MLLSTRLIRGMKRSNLHMAHSKHWLCASCATSSRQKVFGFQSSDHSSPETDAIILERSLRLGCDIFVCSAGRSTTQLERLAEISNIDDVDLDTKVIGNRIKSAADFEMETESAVDSLCGRYLDFSTVPLGLETVSAATHTKSHQQLCGDNGVENSTQACSGEVAALSTLLADQDLGGGRVGVELTTDLLRHCIPATDSDHNMLFAKLPIDRSKAYPLPTLLEVLDNLHSRGLVSVLLCAANVFTLPVAVAVRQWAVDKHDVSFVASEVLRAHPRSPGLLVSPSAANAGIGGLPNMAMTEAVELFNKTANTCIHFEKNFLEKARTASRNDFQTDALDETSSSLPPTFPPLTHLFMGMVLAQAQNTVLFPQEWKSIRDNEVDPNFDKACELLRKNAGENAVIEYDNFLTVYIPMKRNLMRAFDAILNARQELLCQDLKRSSEVAFPDILRSVENDASSVAKCTYSGMALHECLGKAWAGIVLSSQRAQEEKRWQELDSVVLLQGVEVPADMWGVVGSHVRASGVTRNASTQDAAREYIESISATLDREFYDNNE